MKSDKFIFKFNLLPEIKGDFSELSSLFSRDELSRLINHDSMKVYYNISLNNNSFTLTELPTTTARAELILPTIKELLGKNAKDVSLLDIACSPGYFMFKTADLRVKAVTGLDARKDHADQFKILNHFYGYKNISFVHSDLYLFLEQEIAKGNKYDICLLFGFLYHTVTPVELLRMIKAVCKNCLIIDTTLNPRNDKSILIYEEDTKWSRASTSKISFNPSFYAVPLMLEASGFSKIKVIKPLKHLKPLNPGGDNINYYFYNDLISKSLIQDLVSKLPDFPRLKQLQTLTSNIFKGSITTGSRRAFYIAYV